MGGPTQEQRDDAALLASVGNLSRRYLNQRSQYAQIRMRLLPEQRANLDERFEMAEELWRKFHLAIVPVADQLIREGKIDPADVVLQREGLEGWTDSWWLKLPVLIGVFVAAWFMVVPAGAAALVATAIGLVKSILMLVSGIGIVLTTMGVDVNRLADSVSSAISSGGFILFAVLGLVLLNTLGGKQRRLPSQSRSDK